MYIVYPIHQPKMEIAPSTDADWKLIIIILFLFFWWSFIAHCPLLTDYRRPLSRIFITESAYTSKEVTQTIIDNK